MVSDPHPGEHLNRILEYIPLRHKQIFCLALLRRSMSPERFKDENNTPMVGEQRATNPWVAGRE